MFLLVTRYCIVPYLQFTCVLLRPLPFPHNSELMLLHQYDAPGKDPNTFVAPIRLTAPMLHDRRECGSVPPEMA